jgi:hypothetical protein
MAIECPLVDFMGPEVSEIFRQSGFNWAAAFGDETLRFAIAQHIEGADACRPAHPFSGVVIEVFHMFKAHI